MQDKEEITSLVTVLAKLREEGFRSDFKVTDDGRLCTLDGNNILTPDQVRIVDFYRFEGESNPDDMAILYVLETTTGLKGTISDAFGTYADRTIEDFMKQLQDLGKDLDHSS